MMRILAFESSCDETAAAVLERKDGKITVGEFKEYCYKQFDTATQNILKKKV